MKMKEADKTDVKRQENQDVEWQVKTQKKECDQTQTDTKKKTTKRKNITENTVMR